MTDNEMMGLAAGVAIVLFLIGGYLFSKLKMKSDLARLDHLHQTGAARFVADALQLVRTIKLTDKLTENVSSQKSAATISPKEFQRNLQAEERTVEARVCGETVVGVIENNEFHVTVTNPNAKQAIVDAFNHVMNGDAELSLGVKHVELHFVSPG